MAHDVFISHSTIDKAVSDAVCAALENGGIRCWVAPRDVQAGRSFAGEITRAIQESKIMVLIFSAHSNNSEQVLREVQLAVKARLHIIQFRIEDVHLNDDLEYFLSTPHWLDALTPPLENHLRRLETSIKTLLDDATAERAAPKTTSIAPVVHVPERRSRKMWWWICGGMVVALITVGLIWKYWSPAENLQLPDRPAAALAAANEIVVEWASINTLTAPGYIASAAPYLHRGGVSVVATSPDGSEIILINNFGLFEGKAVYPTTSQNMLTQIKTGNVPASFTLKFVPPVESISFTRPALYPATDSGISHPAWSVRALSGTGREVGSQSEGLVRASDADVSARTYTLRAPYSEQIAALRFDSDPQLYGKPYAAFSAVLIERLTLVREPKSSR
jgi:hypothetical protein